MRFQHTDNGPMLLFKHAGLAVEMPWLMESHGTRAFIKMFPFIMSALDTGGIVAIDEMDAAIHPNMLPELVRWFYATSERNNFDAQLWLSCHRSEEHTSELQSLMRISYAVFCLKKKKITN